jgi:AcrR family transcriptional regulator
LASKPTEPVAAPARRRDAERTRANILNAATREFGALGFSGARIERIAKAAKCNIRLLYHYFGNKKQLYMAVLDAAYSDLRSHESALDYDFADPLGCAEKLLRFTFGYFEQNPHFEGLLRTENLMRGKFVTQSTVVPEEAARLRDTLQRILTAGEMSGEIRQGVDPVQLYVTITALSRFHLANAWSLGALLGTDLTTPRWREERLEHAVELLRAWLTSGAAVRQRRRVNRKELAH